MCDRDLVSRRRLSADPGAGEHRLQARDTSVITGQKCLHQERSPVGAVFHRRCVPVLTIRSAGVDGRPVQGRRL